MVVYSGIKVSSKGFVMLWLNNLLHLTVRPCCLAQVINMKLNLGLCIMLYFIFIKRESEVQKSGHS